MRARPDYRRYLLNTPESEAWGLAVTAGGRQGCPAGSPYPPAGHPPDHHFNWETGRVLGACQIVFIAEGRGLFESRATGLVRVGAGTALVVLPGVWHRYAPDPEAGWTEQWVELQGRTVEILCKKGALSPARAVVPMERALELEALMDRIQARLCGATTGFDPEAAALGLHVLALVVEAPRLRAAPRALAAFVAKAERLLSEAVDQPPAIPGLARELGVAYSYFRREFKRHTGLAPYQYVRQMRLEKARRLIGNSSDSLQTIADRLGFASPYHLSAAFKKHYGQAPNHWRRHRD
jgi:AraC-like DNA-binding protein